jgi:hypothetical protein
LAQVQRELKTNLRDFNKGPRPSTSSSSSSSASSSSQAFSFISLLEKEEWPKLAILALQSVCKEVYGPEFGELDEEDVRAFIGSFWYAPQKKDAAVLQAICHYPTTYWENNYQRAKDEVFFSFFFLTFLLSCPFLHP